MNGCIERRRSFPENLAAVSEQAVWGVGSAGKPRAPTQEPVLRTCLRLQLFSDSHIDNVVRMKKIQSLMSFAVSTRFGFVRKIKTLSLVWRKLVRRFGVELLPRACSTHLRTSSLTRCPCHPCCFRACCRGCFFGRSFTLDNLRHHSMTGTSCFRLTNKKKLMHFELNEIKPAVRCVARGNIPVQSEWARRDSKTYNHG